jgi:Na+-transporting methylmalonyl-CoA/oxaloacetate decarboxylase gamma subunit
MLLNTLAVTAENALKGYPKEISIGEAAVYALLGFLVVFAGISLLILIVWAIGKLMAYMKGEPTKKEIQEIKASIIEAKEEQEKEKILEATSNADEPDEETVAVIMAALMSYYETNYPKCEFTVKRIKRI